MKTIYAISLIGVLLFTSCIPTQKVSKNAKMTDFFHFQKADNYDSAQWAVFLPGTGGLRIFKDTVHYYEMANEMNKIGISVLLVDYTAAYKAARKKDIKEEPEQILWTLNQALDWASNKNHINSESKGSLIGWSRAGMAAIPIANNEALISPYQMKSIVLFYPANPRKIDIQTDIPTLILTGEEDKIIRVNDIMAHLDSENVTIKVYDDAYHGFDVKSLKKGKYFRYIPFISKKNYLLKYDQKAAEEAIQEWVDFMKE